MDGTLAAFAIIVSVLAQATALYIMHRTLDTQSKREQTDRIRHAYGNLLKAGKNLDWAFRDLMFYPAGHPYPGTITASQLPPPSYDPFEFVNRNMDQVQNLVREATVSLILDRDDDSVLKTWAEKVEQPFTDFYRQVAANGKPPLDAEKRLKTLTDGLSELAKVARDHFAGRLKS